MAKHQILKTYLEQWLPTLLLGGYPSVTYVEGFSGSGIYEGGEPGSPVIALQTFLKHGRLLQPGRTVNTLFVEKDSRRCAILKQELTKVLEANSPLPTALPAPRVECADHAQILLPALQQMGSLRQPIFAFLDSFGGPDIPLDIARAIASSPASEVLVTFGTSFLIRFGEKRGFEADGDRVFGGTDWRQVYSLPANQKKSFLVSAYRKSLQTAGFTYVTSFEMKDEGNHDLHLVHGTSHPRGLEKMKNSMWSVDRVRGVQFRDPRDPDQGLLEFSLEPEFGPLRRALLTLLRDRPHTIEELKNYAQYETVYRAQHVWPVVRQLISAQQVEHVSSGRLSDNSTLRLAAKPPHVQEGLF